MTDVLEELKVQFVLLKHLDRGSGKLITYYERLGFAFARDVLPLDKVSHPLDARARDARPPLRTRAPARAL